METIYLIDVSGFIYRAFFAIQGMRSHQGAHTGALFGFIRSYLRLIKDFSPKHIACVFDAKNSKASRVKIYPEYKAHRKPTPDELIAQIQEAKEFCELLGLPILAVEGVEADDTMASVACWAEKNGHKAIIVTADKDMAQLISPNISVLNPHKDNLLLDEKKAEEVYKIAPKKMRDFLAIQGDASDNVPGIAGFGPKTAIALLEKYDTLENILEHADEIGGKKAETLKNEKEIALLSQKLVTVDTTVAFPKEISFFVPKSVEEEKLQNFLMEKNFRSLLSEFSLSQKEEKNAPYTVIETEAALEKLIQELSCVKELCIDTETTDVDPIRATLVGIGLGHNLERLYYIPFNKALSPDVIKKHLRPFLQDSGRAFYGHNIKYDMHVLFHADLALNAISGDTILSSYLLNAHQRRHSLDQLSMIYFNKQKVELTDLIGKGKKQITIDQVPVEKVAEYCSEDVEYTIRLKKVLDQKLLERKLDKLYQDVEVPLVSVLFRMEENGIFVDKEELSKQSITIAEAIKELETDIYLAANKTFNLNSPKQLAEVLYIDLGITPPKKGKTQPSTSADVLESLAPYYPVVKKILEYRSLEKLRSTYVDSLPQEINPATGRIHCTFNQSVTATGRLSSQNPNLQNIPIRSELGRNIRKAFRPEKSGFCFLSADYSQIELRILAHISEDPGLLEAFENDLDVHAYTASQIFQVPLEEVTNEMRQRAKAVNFGIIYGQQAFGLSQSLGITMQEASSFIKAYFERYKTVKEFIEKTKEEARKSERTYSLTGRERILPDINSSNQMLRSAAERLAVNTPFQATSADIIKMAMIEIDRWLQDEKLETKMLLQIHDELLFEVPDHELERVQAGVKKRMEQVFSLKVPLTVKISIGKNWKEC